MTLPMIAVHGGAWNVPADIEEACRLGVLHAAEEGRAVLVKGGSAEDAVERAVYVLEDDELFDAGRGSHLDQDGYVSMDAAFMEGRDLQVGATAAIRSFANPILLARRVMTSPHVFLVGEGAERFGLESGLATCDPSSLVTPQERLRWEMAHAQHQQVALATGMDTVGAIAVDAWGHLAAGTSTGGIPFKCVGRVGDTPCIGSGFYADDRIGAALATGEGEAILRMVLAQRGLDGLRAGLEPQLAAQRAVDELAQRVQGHAGLLIVTPEGQVGAAFNTMHMCRAWMTPDGLIAATAPES